MPDEPKVFQDYLGEVDKLSSSGIATEPSYYPLLRSMLQSLGEGITATTNPTRIECGAPDFVVTKGTLTIGYIEAKDIGKNLSDIQQGKGDDGVRFKRYLGSIPNLMLTDFLEFRWYADGKLRKPPAILGTIAKNGKVTVDKTSVVDVAELLRDFIEHPPQQVNTPEQLAKAMARLAHRIRELVIEAFRKEKPLATLSELHRIFQETLDPGLTPERFADMYAQTIAYGLFAARCNTPPGVIFTRQQARDLVPKSNPFLRNVFDHIAGAQLPEIIVPEVNDLAQLLAQADVGSILEDFGKRTAKEDPVVYFYEDFFKVYDPKVRKMRGEFYTPEPVVSYIVRSIDYLLKTTFGRQQGLADPNTLILDPATGTGTFLYDIVKLIHEDMVSQGQKGMWDGYVAQRLLPRLFGFELFMAPYAVAHLKMGLLLQETGYEFQPDQRLGIYLTNTIEEAFQESQLSLAQFIVDEAQEATRIKNELPIMVVLGNPPYAGIPANASTRKLPIKAGTRYRKKIGGKWDWATAKKDMTPTVPTFIGELLDDYYQADGNPLGERNPKWLQDDYVKFIRFGQWRVEKTGQGILGFITNHGYLDNPTFRGMRQSLMNTFTDIYILDLHGNAKKKEVAPDGSKDENVFDIQQGVAIALFVKEPGKAGPAKVYHADLWGRRGKWPDPEQGTKYHTLAETDVATTQWEELQPKSPSYLFVRRQEKLLEEYEQGWSGNRTRQADHRF